MIFENILTYEPPDDILYMLANIVNIRQEITRAQR